MHRDATFSACRTWRYLLTRTWHSDGDHLSVIGLNPSTADESVDDPTIRRIMSFARAWGYGGIRMLNLFAFRATDPRDMRAAENPVGPHNNIVILRETLGRDVLCCWGAHGSFIDRGNTVRDVLIPSRRKFHLGLTASGQPKHPLYLKADTARVLWGATDA